MYSPGCISALLLNRIVYRHELRPVRKRRFHLDIMNHLRHAIHDVSAPKDLRPKYHDVRHRLTIACGFENLGRQDCHSLGIIQLQTARAAFLRDLGSDEDQELLLFTRRQVQIDLLNGSYEGAWRRGHKETISRLSTS